MPGIKDRLIRLLKTELSPRPILEQRRANGRSAVRHAILWFGFMMAILLLTILSAQKTSIDSSARVRGNDDGLTSYDGGKRYLLEAGGDEPSRFTGRKIDTFEVWNWPRERFSFLWSLVPRSFMVEGQGYVTGYNEGMRLGSSLNAEKKLRKVIIALRAFHAANGTYPATIDELCKGKPPFLKGTWWADSVDGYTFSMTSDANSFSVNADPTIQDVTGDTHYFADTSGRIWHSDYHKASTSDIEDFRAEVKPADSSSPQP